MNHLLFFVATDCASGDELWKSDGFGPGTSLVQDIEPGSGGGAVTMITPTALGLFFSPMSSSVGHELHVLQGLGWAPEGAAGHVAR